MEAVKHYPETKKGWQVMNLRMAGAMGKLGNRRQLRGISDGV